MEQYTPIPLSLFSTYKITDIMLFFWVLFFYVFLLVLYSQERDDEPF